jgi:hypothetical protein
MICARIVRGARRHPYLVFKTHPFMATVKTRWTNSEAILPSLITMSSAPGCQLRSTQISMPRKMPLHGCNANFVMY